MSVRVISPANAAKLLAATPAAVPVDATWYMPNSPHSAADQFLHEDRIQNAVFFDLDQVCSPSSFPHMLPTHGRFCTAARDLGIDKADPVLVYDRSGVFSGPRAAWTFALNGHENVYLLDHYPRFKETHGVDTGSACPRAPSAYGPVAQAVYEQNYRSQVIEFDELAGLVATGRLAATHHVFDARSAGRFAGHDPEPRPGLSSGHVPGALSLPFSKVLDASGHYKSAAELADLFMGDFGVDLRRPEKDIIVMCGTGVTAVILKLAIEKVSPSARVRVYDGSWTEWAQRAPNLIERS